MINNFNKMSAFVAAISLSGTLLAMEEVVEVPSQELVPVVGQNKAVRALDACLALASAKSCDGRLALLSEDDIPAIRQGLIVCSKNRELSECIQESSVMIDLSIQAAEALKAYQEQVKALDDKIGQAANAQLTAVESHEKSVKEIEAAKAATQAKLDKLMEEKGSLQAQWANAGSLVNIQIPGTNTMVGRFIIKNGFLIFTSVGVIGASSMGWDCFVGGCKEGVLQCATSMFGPGCWVKVAGPTVGGLVVGLLSKLPASRFADLETRRKASENSITVSESEREAQRKKLDEENLQHKQAMEDAALTVEADNNLRQTTTAKQVALVGEIESAMHEYNCKNTRDQAETVRLMLEELGDNPSEKSAQRATTALANSLKTILRVTVLDFGTRLTQSDGLKALLAAPAQAPNLLTGTGSNGLNSNNN